MIKFVVKKTTELTQEEINQSLQLNNDVFKEQCSYETFIKRNTMNPFGYSYHTLMLVDNQVVGYDSGIPYYYIVNGEKVKAICNIDTMISPKHRGLENFYDMLSTACKCFKEEGFAFVIGYPNDNAYPLLIGTRIMKDIGKMYTYCLPIRIGALKPKLRFLNWASLAFCKTWVSISCLLASKKTHSFIIEKELDSFNKLRYKQFDTNYQFASLNNGEVVFAIKDYQGIRPAFIIDVFPKSSMAFSEAVKHLIKTHQKEFDLVLYPGYLPFKNYGLFRIPRKYEPKNFNFTGMIFDKSIPKDLFYNINSWDTNLSNYDLI